MNTLKVSSSLRIWFVVHFFVDIIFAIGLIFFTKEALVFFGFDQSNFLIARLLGAALVAIGTTSLLVRKASFEVYDAMLTLKLLFSGTAILAICISILEGAPTSTWLFMVIYVVFFAVWGFYKRRRI